MSSEQMSQVKLCAFDVETSGRNPKFVCGSVFSDESVAYFTDAQQMIDELRRHARKGYKLIAHHAEYDIATLLWPAGEDVTIAYSNNIYTYASWRYGEGKRTATIWDNMRLCAGLSLEALGEAIGTPKYARPRSLVDDGDWRRDWVCDDHGKAGCWECYCTRDSEVVWSYANALSEWLGSYGLSLHYSLARSAIDLWQLLDPGQVQTIRNPELRAFCRRAYHGGRCEPFQYGHVGRVYTGDFRCFYGSILRDIQLPDIKTLTFSNGDVGIVTASERTGVVAASLYIEPQHIPPLPVRYRDRTYFPVGLVSGVWPIPELRASLEQGVTIRAVGEGYSTDKTVQPFAATAATLLERRESLRNNRDARELACKYMLNAIPGRMGMRESSERVTYRRWRKGDNGDTCNGAELERAGGALYLARRSHLSRPSATSNVLWAACITGEGRSRLYSILDHCGTEALYCDTDSVHSSSPLPCGDDMPGMFRDTGAYDLGIYLGAKFYSLETFEGERDVRAKGIPRKHAVEFIANRHVAYQTAMGVADGILRGIAPAVWVDVDRVAAYAPGTRTILEPSVLTGGVARSQTTPVVFGAVDDDLTNMESRSMIDV